MAVCQVRIFKHGNIVRTTYVEAYEFEWKRNGFEETEHPDTWQMHPDSNTVVLLTKFVAKCSLDELLVQENCKQRVIT